MSVVDLNDAFGLLNEPWRPHIAAELNGQELKVVKIDGEFPWHHHDEADEMFLVWRGEIRLEFRDRVLRLGPGQLAVVPRGVEHRPVADREAEVLLFEIAGTRNTGNVTDARYTAPDALRI